MVLNGMRRNWGRMMNMQKMGIDSAHTVKIIKKYIKPNDMILDIGCGAGETTYFLEKDCYNHIYNIDIKDMRRFVTKRFQLYDGFNIPFGDNIFNVVMLNFILHHVPNYRKNFLLKEAIRVTKKHLFILEDTPRTCIDRLISYIHGISYRREINSKSNFGFYTQKHWEDTFYSLELKIIISQKLSRFCRRKIHPFTRCFFFLEKI